MADELSRRITEAAMNSTLAPHAKLYLIALAMTANADGVSSASAEELRRLTGIGRDGSQAVVRTLRDLDIITTTRRQRATTLTTVDVESLESWVRPPDTRQSKPPLEHRKPGTQDPPDNRKPGSQDPPPTGAIPADNPRLQPKNNDFPKSGTRANKITSSFYNNNSSCAAAQPNVLGGGGAENALTPGEAFGDPNTQATRTALVRELLQAATGGAGAQAFGAVRAIVQEIDAFGDTLAGEPFDDERCIRGAFEVVASLRGSQTPRDSVGRVRASVCSILCRARENDEYPAVWASSDRKPKHSPPPKGVW
jgi:hypothetical protein